MNDRSQLYLITPPPIANLPLFVEAAKSALGAGDVACLQIRLKAQDGSAPKADDVLRVSEAILPVTAAHDAACLINDDPALAQKAGADGVHIGQSDAPYEEARNLLGNDATIGVTCHDSKHLALVAGEAGADYVAFGAFFPTTTKDVPTRVNIDLVEWWTFATTVPCVAIGGITPENCAPLVQAGADFLAVSAAVWGHQTGPDAAVRAFENAIKAA